MVLNGVMGGGALNLRALGLDILILYFVVAAGNAGSVLNKLEGYRAGHFDAYIIYDFSSGGAICAGTADADGEFCAGNFDALVKSFVGLVGGAGLNGVVF